MLNLKFLKKNFANSIRLKNFINGEFVDSKTSQIFELRSPATNELISEVPLTPKEEFNHAVSIAKEAFKSWRNVPLLSRQRYMFDYLKILKDNQVLSIKLGKTCSMHQRGARENICRLNGRCNERNRSCRTVMQHFTYIFRRDDR